MARWIVTGILGFCVFWYSRVFHGGYRVSARYQAALFLWPIFVACICAWMRKWREFVLLTIVGALCAFSQVADVLIYLSRWDPEPFYPSTLRYYTIKLGLSAVLCAMMAARFVSMGEALSYRRDVNALRLWLTVAIAILAFRVILLPPIVRGDNSDPRAYWPELVLVPTAVAAALAWLGRWRGAVAIGLASQVCHIFFGLRCAAALFFFRVPPDLYRSDAIRDLPEAILMLFFIARFARYALVHEPEPASAQ